MLLSYFCHHGAHEVCKDSYPLEAHFAERLGTPLCECVCHEEEEATA